MKRIVWPSVFLMLLVLSALPVWSQTVGAKRYWVYFTGKTNSGYSLDRPQEFLSEKAIARRERQGIPITEDDLPVSQSQVDALIQAGAKVIHRSRWFNAVSVEVQNPVVLQKISSFSFVQATSAVHTYKCENDERLGDLSEVSSLKTHEAAASQAVYDYGLAYHQTYMLGGDYMHAKGFHGEGMLIAVIDAGFWEVGTRVAFDSLRMNGHLMGTRDFVDGGTSVYEDHTHGMQVLSVMAGNLPGALVGTAPEANYWLLRAEDSGSEKVMEEDNWVVAAEFADSVGADIIHSSIGYTTFDDATEDHSYADLDGKTTVVTKGAEKASSKGILVVNSAGNKGSSPWKYVAVPADGADVLAVGAVDQFKIWAYFSSKGPTYDGRIKPNVVAQGLSTIIASVAPDASPSPRIQTGSGTSFSAPLVSGLAACLWQAHPNATNKQLIRAIEQSGDQYFAPDTLKGYGIPNFAVASMILDGMTRDNFDNDQLIQAYPNPFGDELHFYFYSAVNQTVLIELFNAMGQRLFNDEKRFVSNTYNMVEVEGFPPLPQGVYMLSVSTPIRTFTLPVFSKGIK
ncbi:MAG: S8 family serine peptidase [Flavobacteriales bacterium]|nr:S8 family serine peptidase [Flavobacteriales bacterium]MCB9447634.1 S8 family serine peptidase [Flavobacteriales bacterium]